MGVRTNQLYAAWVLSYRRLPLLCSNEGGKGASATALSPLEYKQLPKALKPHFPANLYVYTIQRPIMGLDHQSC